MSKIKRKLKETEIEQLLDFIKPNSYIPADTAFFIVEKTKKSFRDQLINVKIYPKMIPSLKKQLQTMYQSTLVQPGESVGIITAQSIGEKQTQSNLNSLDWKEHILYTQDNQTKIEPIGQLIDNILKNADKQFIQHYPESHTEYLEIKEKNMYIPSCDYTGKCDWYLIEAVTRHYPEGKLVKVTTQSGRTVTATQAKSFLVWNGEKFVPTNGSEIKVGDRLPTTHTLPFRETSKQFNLRSIFSPTEYIYTSEIIKARKCIHSEWSLKNGKDFILPFNRKDTCFGKRKEYYMSCEKGLIHMLKAKKFVSYFPENIELDNDFGFLVGIYLAEGLVTKTFMSISNNNENIRKRVTDYCDKFGITYHLVINQSKNVRNGMSSDLNIHSVLLARIFKVICDTGSQNKHVPEFAYTAPKEFIQGLLDGYFSGDGCVHLTGNITASSASEKLITGISFLLSYFGIFGKISQVQPKKNNVGSKNIKKSHVLTICNSFAQNFAKKLKLTEGKKQDRLQNITAVKKYRYQNGKNQEGLPSRDVYFDPVVSVELIDGTTEYVYDFTVEKTRNFQTWNGLNHADTFHKAGSSDKQPVVSKFSELLNATNKPKTPSFFIYFKGGNGSVPELRKTIGHSIVHITLKNIVQDWQICTDKEEESWYNIFYLLYGEKDDRYTDCISVKINMDMLYEYKLKLSEIAQVISDEYLDTFCVFSPDCFGKIDIYFDTQNIDIPEDKIIFVTKENAKEIYLEEVAQPILENLTICGIPGIVNVFFVQDGKEWFIESENSNNKEKVVDANMFKNKNKAIGKEKISNCTKRFKKVLAHPSVDMTRTISNNVWDIYYTFGIEAARQYMIDEFSKIMEGINLCHVMLLVDKMTFLGTISSISRYTMRREESGPFGKASFEETLDNFLKAGVFGQEEPTRGVSASIICGKRAPIGTGICDLTMDIDKLKPIKEDSDEDE